MSNPNIRITDATPAPISLISAMAGTTTGRNLPDEKRFMNCWNNHHDSVLEHAKVSFIAYGISRACSHQLVRHRHFSFTQESQRYTSVKTSNTRRVQDGATGKKIEVAEPTEWNVKPDSFDDRRVDHSTGFGVRADDLFRMHMQACADAYQAALDAGIPREDARYLLPEACKTGIACTANLRELLHFFDCRLDKSAQWEIRNLAQAVLDECKEIGVEWARIMELYEDRRLKSL